MTDKVTRAATERIRARIEPGWLPTIDCGEGWWSILARLERDLAEIDPGYALRQVKQKGAGLVYLADPGPDISDADAQRFHTLIEDAETAARRTCEVCGATGSRASLRGVPFVARTLCDDHLTAGDDGRTYERTRKPDA